MPAVLAIAAKVLLIGIEVEYSAELVGKDHPCRRAITLSILIADCSARCRPVLGASRHPVGGCVRPSLGGLIKWALCGLRRSLDAQRRAQIERVPG